MRVIDTGYIDILAHSSAADTVNILTDAIAVAELSDFAEPTELPWVP